MPSYPRLLDLALLVVTALIGVAAVVSLGR